MCLFPSGKYWVYIGSLLTPGNIKNVIIEFYWESARGGLGRERSSKRAESSSFTVESWYITYKYNYKTTGAYYLKIWRPKSLHKTVHPFPTVLSQFTPGESLNNCNKTAWQGYRYSACHQWWGPSCHLIGERIKCRSFF